MWQLSTQCMLCTCSARQHTRKDVGSFKALRARSLHVNAACSGLQQHSAVLHNQDLHVAAAVSASELKQNPPSVNTTLLLLESVHGHSRSLDCPPALQQKAPDLC